MLGTSSSARLACALSFAHMHGLLGIFAALHVSTMHDASSRLSLAAGNSLCAAQFLGMSIWTWKDRSVAQGVAQTVVHVVTHPAQEAASWTAVWLPILMMYSPVQVVCTALAMSFMVAPAAFAAAFWIGGLAVYYAVTLPGAPEHTGGSCSIHSLLT